MTKTYKRWTMTDLAFVRRNLPHTSKRTIASAMGVSVGALDGAIRTHELKKNTDPVQDGPIVKGIKEHIANIRKELEK